MFISSPGPVTGPAPGCGPGSGRGGGPVLTRSAVGRPLTHGNGESRPSSTKTSPKCLEKTIRETEISNQNVQTDRNIRGSGTEIRIRPRPDRHFFRSFGHDKTLDAKREPSIHSARRREVGRSASFSVNVDQCWPMCNLRQLGLQVHFHFGCG
jgi:hypothetical protein